MGDVKAQLADKAHRSVGEIHFGGHDDVDDQAESLSLPRPGAGPDDDLF